ncbi:MAG: tRNA uridine-5-carboxymethylaminomethyl(34) synthesis GTPase MnmE [Bacteroidales bacterium]
MEKSMYETDDIIFALATAWGTGALAVIRISGKGCVAALAPCFSRSEALLAAPTHRNVYGVLFDPQDGKAVDQVVVAVYRDGHGYTGEESAELSCHGSIPGVEAILGLLGRAGMRPANPGEFTFRAFMHGKIDLTRAEAVQEIVGARSRTAQSLALNRLEGALFTVLEEIKGQVLDALSVVEVQLDYAEDEIGGDTSFPFDTIVSAKDRIDTLVSTYGVGRLYSQGARIVLAGSTNAGKSTLFNLLLKQERSIVSDIRGTTRDFIEAEAVVGGVPVRLYDTAGLRKSTDALEQEGIRRTGYLIEQADLILLMLDGTDQLDGTTEQAIGITALKKDPRCIVVWNKTDIAGEVVPDGSFPLSAKQGRGFAGLQAEIVRRLKKGAGAPGDDGLVIESTRQRDELVRASEALEATLRLAHEGLPLDIVAIEMNEAINALGSLTGEVASTDILEHIFSGFCVGK